MSGRGVAPGLSTSVPPLPVPLIINREQIDELVATLRNAISAVAAELDGEWKLASGK